MSKRSYSDREKAEALAVYDSCQNVSETKRITGIPQSTLYQWIEGNVGINDDIPDMREFKKLELAQKLDAIAHQCAGLLPGKLPDSSVREIVGAMSQSIEKGQLLRGSPTAITENALPLKALQSLAEKFFGYKPEEAELQKLLDESFARVGEAKDLNTIG